MTSKETSVSTDVSQNIRKSLRIRRPTSKVQQFQKEASSQRVKRPAVVDPGEKMSKLDEKIVTPGTSTQGQLLDKEGEGGRVKKYFEGEVVAVGASVELEDIGHVLMEEHKKWKQNLRMPNTNDDDDDLASIFPELEFAQFEEFPPEVGADIEIGMLSANEAQDILDTILNQDLQTK